MEITPRQYRLYADLFSAYDATKPDWIGDPKSWVDLDIFHNAVAEAALRLWAVETQTTLRTESREVNEDGDVRRWTVLCAPGIKVHLPDDEATA